MLLKEKTEFSSSIKVFKNSFNYQKILSMNASKLKFREKSNSSKKKIVRISYFGFSKNQFKVEGVIRKYG